MNVVRDDAMFWDTGSDACHDIEIEVHRVITGAIGVDADVTGSRMLTGHDLDESERVYLVKATKRICIMKTRAHTFHIPVALALIRRGNDELVYTEPANLR